MIIKSTAAKIALTRRGVESSGDTGSWHTEFFDVTQSLINMGKLVLANTPIDNTEIIKLNGLEMVNHPDWDYQMSGNEIIFADDINLTVGDTIRVRYKSQI
jgi:hypothetical protein